MNQTAIVAEAAALNRMRWRAGRRGWYEAWYVAFNDPATERGWWLRYSLLAPTDAGRPGICQVWFMRTDRALATRHRAVRATLPIAALVEDDTAGFSLRLGGPEQDAEGRLDAGGCSGRLGDGGDEIAWNLRFAALLPPRVPTPEWGARFASAYLEPHPLLRVSGVIREGGVERRVESLLGEQAHVFGVRHSRRWHWAECKHLGPNAAPGAFVGVAAWLPVGASVTSLSLTRGDAPPWPRGNLLDMLQPRTAHDPTAWRFDAVRGGVRLSGSVTPRLEDLIGVTYHDPSGGEVFCYHSELADLRLELRRRQGGGAWGAPEVIEAPGASTFEYGGAVALPGVPLLLD